MYIIKELWVDGFNQVQTQNGIEVINMNNKLTLSQPQIHWGKISIDDNLFDDILIKTTYKKDSYLLPVANTYELTSIDGICESINFLVTTPKNEIIDGYIVFISQYFNIETDGEKIDANMIHRNIVVLKNDNYLRIGDHTIKVIDSQLTLLTVL